MTISVEYKDTSETISNQTYRLTRLAFAKHLAIAGQGDAPKSQKLIRTLAMFFHYSSYLEKQAFNNLHLLKKTKQLLNSDFLLIDFSDACVLKNKKG